MGASYVLTANPLLTYSATYGKSIVLAVQFVNLWGVSTSISTATLYDISIIKNGLEGAPRERGAQVSQGIQGISGPKDPSRTTGSSRHTRFINQLVLREQRTYTRYSGCRRS